VITAAGVSAGIDMAFDAGSQSRWSPGQAFAEGLQLAIEYDPAPPFDTGSPDKAPGALVARISSRLRANFRYPNPVSNAASANGKKVIQIYRG
jgi:hypothetical protein